MTLKRKGELAALACLGLFAALSFATALRESGVFDEPTHITSGFLYWKTGRYFLNPMNAPLIRLWATLPLLAMPLQVPLPVPAWVIEKHLSLSDLLFNYNPVHQDIVLNACRAMIVLLGVGLGALIFRWTRELLDTPAAVAAVGLYAFCPPMLAYSHLATADLGSAGFSLLALYLFWRFEEKSSRQTAFWAGVGMGLNVAAKFTGLFLLPILGLIDLVRRQAFPERSPRKPPYVLLSYVLGGALVMLVVYRFTELWRIGQGLEDLRPVLTLETNQYFHGVYNVTGHSWWWFYSACLLLKTPLPLLVLGSFGVYLAAKRRYPEQRAVFLWILLPSLLYLGMLSLTNSQLGIRRVLFLYPMACIWGGGALAALWKERRWRVVCGLLAGWYVLETLILFPRYFSYFNQLAGGPAGGSRYLVDCNADWGQGLKALGKYLKQEGVDTVYLSYYGGSTPAAYGIRYMFVGPAMSAFVAQHSEPTFEYWKAPKALLAVCITAKSGTYFAGQRYFEWLGSRQPVARVMDSILVYDITNDPGAHRELAVLFRQFDQKKQADLELASLSRRLP